VRARLAGSRRWATVAVVYFAIACAFSPHALSRLRGHGYQAGLGDPGLIQWWLAYIPHAIWHGQNPLVSHLLFAPGGVSAVQNSSMILPAVVFAPVTRIWGAATTFNLIVLLAPPLTSFTGWLWLRRHAGPVAAFVGALTLGFTVGSLHSETVHPFLTLLALIPLLLIVLERSLAGEGRWWVNALWLGVLVAAQALTGAEALTIALLSVAIGAVLLALQRPRDVIAAVRRSAAPIAGGAALAGVLLAYPLAMTASAHWHLSSTIQRPDTYVARPTELLRRPPDLLFAPGRRGAYYESWDVYLGPVLLALIVVVLVWQWRDLVCRTAAGVGAVMTVLSWGGRSSHGVRLPWSFVEAHSLVLANALTVRFAIATWFCIGLLVARSLTALTEQPVLVRAGGIAALAVAFASVVPATVGGPTRLTRTPAFFTAGMPGIPRGAIVLLAPSPAGLADAAMQWQVDSDFRFAMTGGYMVHPQSGSHRASFLTDSIADQLFRPPPLQPTLAFLAAARADLRNRDICAIIIGPDKHLKRDIATATLLTDRPADLTSGGVRVWYLGCPRPTG
jgi:hypothetical protein